jgi:hypothetical protein
VVADAQRGREGGEGGTHASMQGSMDDSSKDSADRQHGAMFVGPMFEGRVERSDASGFSSVQNVNEEGQHGPFADGPVFRGEVAINPKP